MAASHLRCTLSVNAGLLYLQLVSGSLRIGSRARAFPGCLRHIDTANQQMVVEAAVIASTLV